MYHLIYQNKETKEIMEKQFTSSSQGKAELLIMVEILNFDRYKIINKRVTVVEGDILTGMFFESPYMRIDTSDKCNYVGDYEWGSDSYVFNGLEYPRSVFAELKDMSEDSELVITKKGNRLIFNFKSE